MLALRILIVSLGLWSMFVLSPKVASAVERQHHVGIDPSLSILKVADKSTTSVGSGLSVHYTYGLSDQFNLMAELNASRVAMSQDQDQPSSPRTRPTTVAHGLGGIGYVIDVLRWVPYVGILVGGYHLSGGTLDANALVFGGAVQLGLNYQLTRHWAAGASGQQHFLVTQLGRYPSYTTVMLRLEYMWGF